MLSMLSMRGAPPDGIGPRMSAVWQLAVATASADVQQFALSGASVRHLARGDAVRIRARPG
jgi:hypothetical protein